MKLYNEVVHIHVLLDVVDYDSKIQSMSKINGRGAYSFVCRWTRGVQFLLLNYIIKSICNAPVFV